MASKADKFVEPYRFLFPAGAILGVVGSSLWILFQLQWIHFYPRFAHANLMYFGLLWSFVAGFLMTAIPKMTSSSAVRNWEIGTAVFLALSQLILNLLDHVNISVLVYALQSLFLIFFVVRRFLVHKKVPFSGFMFLPLAFLQSLLGVILFYQSDFQNRQVVTVLCGDAFVLNLILGLGSRLIPVISRLPNALLPNEAAKRDAWMVPSLIAIFLNLGFWFQLASFESLSYSFKTLAVAVACTLFFKIFVRPMKWSFVGMGLKASVVLLFLGQVLSLSFFQMGLAAIHLMYIGGFSLITFLISTRVMLAHGSQDLSYEVSSWRIAAISVLFVVSSLLRFAAGTNVMGLYVFLSVLLFVISMGLWGHKFFSILFSLAKK